MTFTIPLLNGLYFLHPLLLLIFYSYVSTIYIYKYKNINLYYLINDYEYKSLNMIKLKYICKKFLLLLILTLFLGAY